MSRQEIMGLLFLPGFRSKGTVTDISGRGVGLDLVVKSMAPWTYARRKKARQGDDIRLVRPASRTRGRAGSEPRGTHREGRYAIECSDPTFPHRTKDRDPNSQGRGPAGVASDDTSAKGRRHERFC